MNRFVVHDEDGPLRAFATKRQAEDFLKSLIKDDPKAHLVVLPPARKAHEIDWDNFEESPF